jgi:predicted permease
MRLLSIAKSFFRSLFHRQRIDADLDDEVRSTVELLADQKVKEGVPPEEARRAARIELGGVEQVKEEVRSGRASAWLDTLSQDLRFGLRMLRKSPGFTVAVVITLALGIGVNTAIFSVVNDLVLRPLPVARPSEIAFLLLSWKGGAQDTAFAYPYFREIQEQTSNIFSGVTASQPYQMDGLSMDRKSEPMWTAYLTGNFFDVLGVKPVLGRLTLPSEGLAAGADPVLVISYSYWKSRFNRDPNIIGKKVTVNGHPMTLVGVTPEGFHGLTSLLDTQGYIPLGMAATLKDATPDFLTATNSGSDAVVARLRSGIDLQQAQSALQVVAHRMALQHPALKGLMNFRILHLGPAGLAINPTHPEALTLVSALFLALAGSVLVLACVNIANLLLVRSESRQREMAMRAALGATRARLIHHLLTESILLALLGGAAGLLLGASASQAVASIPIHSPLPIIIDFSFDWRVFAYAFGAALLTGLLVGITPALRAARGDVNQILHDGGRTSTAGRRRVRSALIVVQLGGSLMLLIVAGLFVRSLENVEHSNLGFDPNGVLNVSFDPHEAGYDAAQTRAFFHSVLEHARHLPGVESAGLAYSVPMGYYNDGAALRIPGYQSPPTEGGPYAGYNQVSSGYFETMGIPLLRGRDFLDSDGENSTHVAIISQAMAERYWQGQDAIGQHFSTTFDPKRSIQIVGVVGNIKPDSLTPQQSPFFYMPLAQSDQPMATLHVRTAAAPETMASEVIGLIHSLDPTVPVFEVQPMTAALETLNGFLIFQFAAGLAMCLGILGLTLAVVGAYGVISYAASRRTHEIGIRMALGAQALQVLGMILRQGVVIVAAGVVAGIAAAAGMARLVGNFLIGVPPLDSVTYVGASVLLAAVALIACYIPARRAMRVDPMQALRHE